jgi:hypothetical protein
MLNLTASKRLTVHLGNVEQEKIEVFDKNLKKTVFKTKIVNTLSFPVKNDSHANSIVEELKSNDKIVVTKSYTSNIK